jgi:hypothetical protein
MSKQRLNIGKFVPGVIFQVGEDGPVFKVIRTYPKVLNKKTQSGAFKKGSFFAQIYNLSQGRTIEQTVRSLEYLDVIFLESENDDEETTEAK